jgi:hypothetical protein
MKEATSWPDALIAVAGIGFVSAVSLALIWQGFDLLRSRLIVRMNDAPRQPNRGDAQGEAA